MIYTFCESCYNKSKSSLCETCTTKARMNIATKHENTMMVRETPLLYFCHYKEPFSKLISIYKGNGTSSLKHLHKILFEAASRLAECTKHIQSDCIVPIPPRGINLKGRPNLCLNFAYLFASLSTRPLFENLLMNKNFLSSLSTPQKNKNLMQRVVSPPEYKVYCQNPTKLILIDDVWTSGSTMLAAKRALEQQGHSVRAMICFSKVSDR